MDSQTLILGIDPGLSGALALYCLRAKEIVHVIDMPLTPTHAGKKGVDPDALTAWIDYWGKRILLACVEEVGAHATHGRKQGAVSMFNFGYGAGILDGVLASYMIPRRFVAPAGWKVSMGLSRDKGVSRTRATALFPEAAHWFKRAKDDGRAEACLLALFGARGLTHIKTP